VLQRRREIGIRLAIGARSLDIARRVTLEVFVMVFLGAAAGLGLGMASARYVESLLYQVKAADLGSLALPSLAILAAALLAALPPVIRAVRIDPVTGIAKQLGVSRTSVIRLLRSRKSPKQGMHFGAGG
jgi:ABC-type antimicrobial peptide transport system permease subunit